MNKTPEDYAAELYEQIDDVFLPPSKSKARIADTIRAAIYDVLTEACDLMDDGSHAGLARANQLRALAEHIAAGRVEP